DDNRAGRWPTTRNMQVSTGSGILPSVQHMLTPEPAAEWHPRSRYYGWYIVGLLTVINFINYLDRMVVVTMYDDLRRIFKFTNGQLGALSSGFFLVHALATLPLGWASDRFDRRRVMTLGVLAWSAATLLSAYAVGFISMLLLRALVGIGEASYGPASNAILCEVDRRRKARLNAIYNSGMFAGACAGLYLGGQLGFPLAFKLVALPGFVLCVLVWLLDVPPRRAELQNKQAPTLSHVAKEMADGIRRTLSIPTLRWMLASGTLISFAAGGYITWIVDFTVQVKGMSQDEARPLYAFIALSGGILGVLAGGIVGDRWQRRSTRGRVLTIATGFFCAVPFCIGVILVDHGWPYLVIAWLLMFFLPFYSGPMPAVIDDVVDAEHATSAQASFIPFLHILGTGPSAVIMGAVSEHPAIGMRWAFILPAAATLLAGVCALRASYWVSEDIEARTRRAAQPNQTPLEVR
ncbi:MAG TPA: MFS transporter, partial [Polyangiales bacterium]|nr:MFS transporter [Polyangiales bacterium]